MADHEVDETLLRQAVRYLLEQRSPIELIGGTEVSGCQNGRPNRKRQSGHLEGLCSGDG